MKLSIARLPSNLTFCQRLRLQRSAKVNELIVGLEIPANTFRRKMVKGKMFTPLCFFCKCTPNYVYIDLKRSLSKLTSCQCKFDLMSMSKTSKLYQDVYHSTRLDGTKVFILFCGYSGPTGNFHKPYRCSIRFFFG